MKNNKILYYVKFLITNLFISSEILSNRVKIYNEADNTRIILPS